MPWQQDAPNAGFSSATPWLPVDARHFALAADRQTGDSASVYECVRDFLRFRKRQPALLHGDLNFLPVRHNVLTYTRSTDDQTLLLSFNLDGEERRIDRSDLDSFNGARLEKLDEYNAPQGAIAGEALLLPPRSMLIAEVR